MKKSFTDTNAAAAFITKPQPAADPDERKIPPVDTIEQGESEMRIIFRKKRSSGEETRSIRKQILICPSISNAIDEYAKGHRLSFNGIAEEAFKYYMQTHEKDGELKG